MIRSMVRLLRDPFVQDVARTNAQQAAARLAHRRRERQEVEAYLAQLPGPTRATGASGGMRRPDVR